MNKWIERGLYKLFGWWRWTRRFRRVEKYALNAFSGNKLRVLVSELNQRGQHDIQIEKVGRDRQWRRIGSVAEDDFSELMSLLADAGHFIRPGAFRWKFVNR